MAERKKFVNIEVPILKRQIQALGSIDTLKNKTIKLDLSRKLKGKGLTMTIKLIKKENELIGLPKHLEVTKSYLRRIIRKRTNYVEDSFYAQCEDVKVTMKPFLITRKKVSRVVRKNLRNTTRDFLINYVKDKKYLVLCDELLENVLQRELLPKLKKVYPLAFCDLRIFETKDVEKINFEEVQEEPKQENASKE